MAKRIRRKVRPRRHAKKVRSLIPLNRSLGSGFANSMLIKMVYSDVLTPTTSTTPQNHFYRVNDLFDPDFTGGGHQPYYFDQMAGIYARFVVYGCQVTVTTTCTSGSALTTMKTQRDVTGIADTSLALERPGVKKSIVNSGGPSKTLSAYYSIGRISGVGKAEIRTGSIWHGAFDTSPARQEYVQISYQHPDQVNSSTGTIVVQLKYYCKWFDRKRVAQS